MPSALSLPTSRVDRGRRRASEPVAAKVPKITVVFWVIKLITTGIGEATSDYLGNLNLVLAGVVGLGGFALAMWAQRRTRRYNAVAYWFAVLMVAVFGTMVADGIHVGLGIPYEVSTPVFAIALAVVFYRWRKREGTLSIHSITTRSRETYYWLTVLTTFALGTAAGDLTAVTMHLGYFSSIIVFAAIIAIPIVGRAFLGLNGIVAFWFAYVVTRPLGASVADWFAKPRKTGGLDVGDGTVAAIGFALIAAFVAYVACRRNDIQSETAPDGVLSG